MSKLKAWVVSKYLKFEEQAVRAIQTADFYGNLFTERQKFYIAVVAMALMLMSGLPSAVQFIGLIYIMNKMTPDDEKDDKQE